jgi:hypothetical protein
MFLILLILDYFCDTIASDHDLLLYFVPTHARLRYRTPELRLRTD